MEYVMTIKKNDKKKNKENKTSKGKTSSKKNDNNLLLIESLENQLESLKSKTSFTK